jgi:iron complex outermembrane receptor protein
VPPILLQDVGTDHQHDRALRTTAEWRRTGDKVTSFVRAAWFNEELWWYGSGADSAAYSRSRTLVTEGEMRFRRGESHLFGIGVHGTFAEAVADGYSAGRRQDRAALFASYRFRPRGGRFTGTASIHQEMADGSPVPFTWSAGGEYRLRPALTAKTNVSRLFRLPTLNDLYWTPGGDPDLLPESGYGGELGVALKYGSGERFGVEAELTTYQRTMDNWIIWLPAGSYWSPQNLMQVWSRGIEFRGEATGRVGQVQVTVGVMTNYTVSTNERAKSANDASVDKQLIYVPMYSGHARLGLAYKELSITGLTSYTGYRYTSTDNRSYLEPYWLSNAWLAYRLRPMKRYTVSLQAQCNNIFAAEYQVMLNRPMPLRSYQLGISVRFRGTPTQTS